MLCVCLDVLSLCIYTGKRTLLPAPYENTLKPIHTHMIHIHMRVSIHQNQSMTFSLFYQQTEQRQQVNLSKEFSKSWVDVCISKVIGKADG